MKIEMDKQSEDYLQVKRANVCFLFCIIFEVVGIMTMLFWGSIGAQLAIYFMTLVFAICLAKKTNLSIPLHPIKLKSEDDWKSNVLNLSLAIGTTICGIPIAMLLNSLASVLSSGGNTNAEDVNVYPIWLSLLVFAIIPAIVEEYVFRGVILEEYQVLGTKAAIFMSSLFFALLHFSLGSVLYGFFFGCVFALVRLSTENVIMTMAMHVTFNGINVLLSYANLETAPNWIIVMSILVGIFFFMILFVGLLYRNPVVIENGRYQKKCALTKEGYIAVSICAIVIIALLFIS